MSTSSELMYSILAMDAYNRGYNPGILLSGSNIGTATIGSDELLPAGSQAAGFYAVAYQWNGETIISYRGTELLRRISSRQPRSFCLDKRTQNQVGHGEALGVPCAVHRRRRPANSGSLS